MKRLLLGMLSLFPALGWAQAEKEEGDEVGPAAPAKVESRTLEGKVLLIKVGEDDLGSERKFESWEKALKRANEEKARAVVFEIDSPGGLAYETRELMTAVAKLEMPSIAYAKGDAISAAAMLAVATDTIYIGPDSLIGAAGLISGRDNDEAVLRKFESVYVAHLRAIIEKQGHDFDLIYAMMIPAEEEMQISGIKVAKGELLTLTAREASAAINGKQVLAKAVVNSLEEVLEKEGLAGADVIDSSKALTSSFKPVAPEDRQGVSRDGEKKKDESVLKAKEESFEGKVVVLRVGERDLINKQSFKFWRRMLRRAEDEKAKAIVFEIDTPGGYAFETKKIMTEITRVKIPSYAYVQGDAISAGALVSVATDAIYMGPDSLIGAAGLVSTAGQMDEVMRAKVESLFNAHVRVIAEKKGRDLEVIRAMMIRDDEERKFGDVVVPPKELLTLTATEAVSIVDGKPLLAAGIVNNIEELLAKEGLEESEVVRAEPTGFEQLAWWVAMFSPILILIGVGAAYVEMKAPGFGVAGGLSLAAFGLFFFGNYAAGNLAGYEMVALFVLGIILILVEIFLIPGTGVTGILGALLMIFALLFGMVDRIDWADYKGGEYTGGGIMELLSWPALALALGLIGGVIFVVLLMRYLPSIPMFRWLTVEKQLAGGASILESTAVVEERVGWTGETVTDLRPAGKVEFAEETLDVVADGEFILKGAKVRIIQEDGMRIVVREV